MARRMSAVPASIRRYECTVCTWYQGPPDTTSGPPVSEKGLTLV